jgi:zinc protease
MRFRSSPVSSVRLVAFAVAFAAAPALVLARRAPAQIPDSAAVARLARTPDAPLPFDARARRGQLSNGLQYFIRANTRPEKRAELRLAVNVGSVLEDDDQLGLAHVLEHMAFNGTRRFAKQAIVDFIERAGMTFGADLNAGTSFDETVYQIQVPTDTGGYVALGLDWFADIAGGGILIDSVALEKERPVVIEEWRLGTGADSRIQEKQFPSLFKGSRYAVRLPIGTKESLDRFTRAEVVRFYREWYRPELMAVVAVGDFNVDSVEALIKSRFGSIPASPATVRERIIAPVPGHAETLVAVTTDPEATESNVGIIWKQSPMHRRTVRDYQRDLTELLFLSMLNQRLDEITHRPNAPFVQAGAGQGMLVRSAESFSLSAVVEDGGIEAGLRGVLTEAERVRRFGFTAPEFDRQKAQILRSIDLQYAERDKTSSATHAARYTDHFLTGDPLLGIEVRAFLVQNLLPAIRLTDINALAYEWLTDSNRVILASAPEKSGVTVPGAGALLGVVQQVRSAPVTAYTDAVVADAIVPAPPQPGRILSERKIAEIGVTEWRLSNGARVLIKPTDFQADEILITGLSAGGIGGLPAERYYSAILGPQMLEYGGVGEIDAVALRNMLAGKAAYVSASIDDRSQSVSGRTSLRDIETFFELMWARTQTPRVDTAAVTALKQQYIGFIRNRINDPAAVFSDTIGQIMSQRNPKARPVSVDLVESLDVAVGADVFRDRFRDFSDFTFIVVGAIQPEQLRPYAERWIAALPGGGRRETPQSPGITPPRGPITYVMRKGTEPKADTRLLITGETPWSRDAVMRAAAITDILDMRLRDVLREDLGGTYGVAVGTSIDRWPEQRFTTSLHFGSAPERADSLANVALDVLRRFAANGPTADELDKVRENLRRNRETSLKQNGFWMTVLENYAIWNDDPAEAVRTFSQRVTSLDANGVRDLARIVLNEANLARFTLLPETRTSPDGR